MRPRSPPAQAHGHEKGGQHGRREPGEDEIDDPLPGTTPIGRGSGSWARPARWSASIKFVASTSTSGTGSR